MVSFSRNDLQLKVDLDILNYLRKMRVLGKEMKSLEKMMDLKSMFQEKHKFMVDTSQLSKSFQLLAGFQNLIPKFEKRIEKAEKSLARFSKEQMKSYRAEERALKKKIAAREYEAQFGKTQPRKLTQKETQRIGREANALRKELKEKEAQLKAATTEKAKKPIRGQVRDLKSRITTKEREIDTGRTRGKDLTPIAQANAKVLETQLRKELAQVQKNLSIGGGASIKDQKAKLEADKAELAHLKRQQKLDDKYGKHLHDMLMQGKTDPIGNKMNKDWNDVAKIIHNLSDSVIRRNEVDATARSAEMTKFKKLSDIQNRIPEAIQGKMKEVGDAIALSDAEKMKRHMPSKLMPYMRPSKADTIAATEDYVRLGKHIPTSKDEAIRKRKHKVENIDPHPETTGATWINPKEARGFAFEGMDKIAELLTRTYSWQMQKSMRKKLGKMLKGMYFDRTGDIPSNDIRKGDTSVSKASRKGIDIRKPTSKYDYDIRLPSFKEITEDMTKLGKSIEFMNKGQRITAWKEKETTDKYGRPVREYEPAEVEKHKYKASEVEKKALQLGHLKDLLPDILHRAKLESIYKQPMPRSMYKTKEKQGKPDVITDEIADALDFKQFISTNKDAQALTAKLDKIAADIFTARKLYENKLEGKQMRGVRGTPIAKLDEKSLEHNKERDAWLKENPWDQSDQYKKLDKLRQKYMSDLKQVHSDYLDSLINTSRAQDVKGTPAGPGYGLIPEDIYKKFMEIKTEGGDYKDLLKGIKDPEEQKKMTNAINLLKAKTEGLIYTMDDLIAHEAKVASKTPKAISSLISTIRGLYTQLDKSEPGSEDEKSIVSRLDKHLSRLNQMMPIRKDMMMGGLTKRAQPGLLKDEDIEGLQKELSKLKLEKLAADPGSKATQALDSQIAELEKVLDYEAQALDKQKANEALLAKARKYSGTDIRGMMQPSPAEQGVTKALENLNKLQTKSKFDQQVSKDIANIVKNTGVPVRQRVEGRQEFEESILALSKANILDEGQGDKARKNLGNVPEDKDKKGKPGRKPKEPMQVQTSSELETALQSVKSFGDELNTATLLSGKLSSYTADAQGKYSQSLMDLGKILNNMVKPGEEWTKTLASNNMDEYNSKLAAWNEKLRQEGVIPPGKEMQVSPIVTPQKGGANVSPSGSPRIVDTKHKTYEESLKGPPVKAGDPMSEQKSFEGASQALRNHVAELQGFMGTDYQIKSQLVRTNEGWSGSITKVQQVHKASFMDMMKEMLSVKAFLGKIIHYITFSFGVQLVMQLKEGWKALGDSFKQFEKSIIDAVAISGKIRSGFGAAKEAVTDLAVSLSKDTVYSANEVAAAMYDIASAGYDVTEMTKQELIPILNYAAATQSDLKEATQSVLATIKSFEMELEDSAHIADIFTSAITTSFLTMQKIKEGMKYVGPLAGTLGIGLEETTAGIAVLANRGMEGSQAGQRLNMVFTKLLKPTEKAKTMLEGMGLSMEELNPNAHSLIEILYKLQAAGFGAAEAATMFRARTAGAATVLVESTDEIANLVAQYKQAQGITQSVAQTQQTGIWATTKMISDEFAELAIELGDKLAPALINIARLFQNVANVGGGIVVNFMNAMSSASGSLGGHMTTLLAAFAAWRIALSGSAKKVGVLILKTMALTKVKKLLAVAEAKGHKDAIKWLSAMKDSQKVNQVALKGIASQLGVVQTRWERLGAVISSHPVLTVVAITALAVGAFIALSNALRKTTDSSRDFTMEMGLQIGTLGEQDKVMQDRLKNYEDYQKRMFAISRFGLGYGSTIEERKETLASDERFTYEPIDVDIYEKTLKHISDLSGMTMDEVEKELQSKVEFGGFTIIDVSNDMKGYLAQAHEMLKIDYELVNAAQNLTDEYKYYHDAMIENNNAQKEALKYEYALALVKGENVETTYMNKQALEAFNEAQALHNQLLEEGLTEFEMIKQVSEGYASSLDTASKAESTFLGGINRMITQIREFNISLGKDVEKGSLDDWIGTYEDVATARAALSVEEERSARFLLQQDAATQKVAESLITYGAGSKEAADAQAELDSIIRQRAQSLRTEADLQEQIKTGQSRINEVLKDSYEGNDMLADAERVLMKDAMTLIDVREEYIRLTTSQLKMEAKMEAMNYAQENHMNIMEGKLRLFLEAQKKVFDIEEKLYKLRTGEDEQMEDLFDSLAEQGLLTDDMIDQYTRLEKAQGGVAKLQHPFAQAFGELSNEQKGAVSRFMEENSWSDEDLKLMEGVDLSIFEEYNDAQDELTAATEDFADSTLPLVDGMKDVGAISEETATKYYDIIDNANEAATANFDLVESQKKVTDTMQGLLNNTALLANSYITGAEGAEDMDDVYATLLTKMGIFESEGEAEAGMLDLLNELFGVELGAVSDFSNAQLIAAATLLETIQNLGLYEDGMSALAMANALGISSMEDLMNMAQVSAGSFDPFSEVTDSLSLIGEELDQLDTTLMSLNTSLETLNIGLGEMNTIEGITLTGLQYNFADFANQFEYDLKAMLEGTDIDLDWNSIFGNLDFDGWKAFAKTVEDTEGLEEIFSDVFKVDLNASSLQQFWKDLASEGNTHIFSSMFENILGNLEQYLDPADLANIASKISDAISIKTADYGSWKEGPMSALGVLQDMDLRDAAHELFTSINEDGMEGIKEIINEFAKTHIGENVEINWDEEEDVYRLLSRLSSEDLVALQNTLISAQTTLPIDIPQTELDAFIDTWTGWTPDAKDMIINQIINTDPIPNPPNPPNPSDNEPFVGPPAPTRSKTGVDKKIVNDTIDTIRDKLPPIFGDLLPRFAAGGVVNRPTAGVFGEEGQEYLVPTQGKYKKRGLELFLKLLKIFGPKLGINPKMIGRPDLGPVRPPRGGGGYRDFITDPLNPIRNPRRIGRNPWMPIKRPDLGYPGLNDPGRVRSGPYIGPKNKWGQPIMPGRGGNISDIRKAIYKAQMQDKISQIRMGAIDDRMKTADNVPGGTREEFNVLGPVYVEGVKNLEEFGSSMKYRYRAAMK